MRIKVKDLYKEERPREKALRYGVETLSNRELLAIVLRCGYKGVSVLQLADQVLSTSKGLLPLLQMDMQSLCAIKGISQIKAIEIGAILEMSKRIAQEKVQAGVYGESPQLIAEYLIKKIGFHKQEHFLALFLDTKNKIIKDKVLFIGSLNQSVVHTREIFKEAISCSGAKIVVAHNHPSNNCTPSESDILVTNTIMEVGNLVGIPLLDHLIVGMDQYFSFKEKGLL